MLTNLSSSFRSNLQSDITTVPISVKNLLTSFSSLNLKVLYALKKEPPLKTFFELYLSLSDIFMRFSCKNQYNFYGWSTNFGLVDFTWTFCSAFLGSRAKKTRKKNSFEINWPLGTSEYVVSIIQYVKKINKYIPSYN